MDLVAAEVFAGYRRHLVEYAPVAATALGDHSRDTDLDDWPPGAADARLRDLGRLRQQAVPPEAVDVETQGDHVLLADALDAARFQLEGLRAHEQNPLFWLDLATRGVYELVRREDLDPEPRRRAAAARAAQVPRLLDQARATLDGISAPHREVALQRAPGAAALFRGILPRFAPTAAEAGEAAAAACEAFARWLDERREEPAPDWRLGDERWAEALRLELGVRMPAVQIWERAWAALEEYQAEAEEAAAHVLGAAAQGVHGQGVHGQGLCGQGVHGQGLRGPDLVRAGLDVIAADRPSRDVLVREAASVLSEITAFLRGTDLFPLPEPDTLRVEELPSFMQGVFVACLVPAPPLEPSAAYTYYLSPVPADWDDERATSFLREYNRSTLQSIGIHEAYPGHYVQFAHAWAHPRLLRRALWNNAFLEGWAVYAEREVLAAGFGDARLRLTRAKRELRVAANALLDQGLHIHGWDDQTALSLMIDRTYQERAEARGKLVRGKVTAGQLSTYFVGGQEMADLRRAAASGNAFSLPAFHREVLAHGTPPFPVLRRALGVDQGPRAPSPDPP